MACRAAEDNEFRAEPLTEALSVNDAAGECEDVKFALVQGVSLRLKKSRSSVAMPANQESCDMRLKEKLQYSVNQGGKNIPKCIHFNKGARKEASCRYEHVCLRCGGGHPATECDQPPVMK